MQRGATGARTFAGCFGRTDLAADVGFDPWSMYGFVTRITAYNGRKREPRSVGRRKRIH